MNFTINKDGRDFVVGDLHGCYDLFDSKLKEINFDKTKDRMFSVGDLIDRGDQNLQCLALIGQPWFHAVRGNHEDMMIDAVVDRYNTNLWYMNGGDWSYDVAPDELEALAVWLQELPLAITVETKDGKVGICHAQPPSTDWSDTIDPDKRSEQIMIWGRTWIADTSMSDVKGVVKTYHGHTPVKMPVTIGNVNFIDTGAVFVGNLTVVQL